MGKATRSEPERLWAAELERLMLERGWTQVEFARRLGISHPTLNLRLRGKVALLPRQIVEMSAVLGVDYRDVLAVAVSCAARDSNPEPADYGHLTPEGDLILVGAGGR